MRVLDRAQETLAFRRISTVDTRRLLLIGLLVALLATGVFSRFWRLGTPGEFFFDEVYFPDTAQKLLGRELADGEAGPWEFFGSENTHPPLSKLIMAGGMAAFGLVTSGSITGEIDNPFAWRFFGALAGVGSIVFIYLLGRRLFNSEFVGITAGFLLTFEGLAFTQSRIGTPDTFVLFFILGAIYFLVSDRYLLSGIFLGAAAATKWTAALTIFPIGLYFIYRFLQTDKEQRRRFLLHTSLVISLFFILVPGYVYFLTYVPMLLSGHSLRDVWELNRQAFEFHSSLDATHAYQSAWNTWPILLRPVFLHVSGSAKIYNLGNPMIFWFGLPALAFALWQGLRTVRARLDAAAGGLLISGRLGQEHFALLFVVLTYVVFWLPWAIQPRIMFLYHYLPALPFLILALAYAVHRLWQHRWGRYVAATFLAVVALTFLYFYPHLAAVSVPGWLGDSYFWLDWTGIWDWS